MPPCRQTSTAPRSQASTCGADFVEIEIVGPAAQIFAELAFRERAEFAAEIADIGVVDIPGDDIGHAIAAIAARSPSAASQTPQNPARAPPKSATISASPSRDPAMPRHDRVELSGGRTPERRAVSRRRPASIDRCERSLRRRMRASPAVRSAGASQARARRISWIDRQPLNQHLPALAVSREALRARPRPLRIDVVGRDRRNAAPIIDAGRENCAAARPKVRRRLDVHRRAEDQPRHGDGPQMVGERRLRRDPPFSCRAWRGSSEQ